MTTQTTATLDNLDLIDVIHDRHPKDSDAYKAISTLNRLLVQVMDPRTDNASCVAVKEFIARHQDQPGLFDDMLEIVDLFAGHVRALEATRG